MIKDLHVGFGLDPDFRFAKNESDLSADKRLILLNGFTGYFGLSGQLVGGFFSKDVDLHDANVLLGYGAGLLRDCYGKINYLIAPSVPAPLINAASKTLRSFRDSIHIVCAACKDAPPDESADGDVELKEIDEFLSYSRAQIEATVAELNNQDGLSVGLRSGAALCAAKELMERCKQKHARFVVLFTD